MQRADQLQPPGGGVGRSVRRPSGSRRDARSAAAPQPCGDNPRRQLPAEGETQIRAVPPAGGRPLLIWQQRQAAASQGGLRGTARRGTATGTTDDNQPTDHENLGKHRSSRRPSQGGTTPRTYASQAPGVGQFLMSEVAKFQYSLILISAIQLSSHQSTPTTSPSDWQRSRADPITACMS